MDGNAVTDLALTTALALPAVTHEHPFGPDWEVFKVAGKVFLLVTEVPGEAVATLKCDPHEGASLQQAHTEITPGYHMNKRHWITIRGGPGVTDPLVRDLVTNSYALVVEGMPRARRPIDTSTLTQKT